MKTEKIELCLLLGEFGTAVTNPPVEVRVIGDLFSTDALSGESACSEIINLNGITTTNVIPLDDKLILCPKN